MRILDLDKEKSLKEIVLYLNLEEAKEMLDGLKQLIDNFPSDEHIHINDIEYKHEITLVLYDECNLKGFNERSKILIKEDR